MNILTLIFRLLHIVAGILWAGGAMHYFLFIEPTAKATAPDSQKFMGYLMTQRQWTRFMGAVSLLTVVGGAALYYRLFSVDWHWILTGSGIGFSLGALAGFSAFAAGNLLVGPRVKKLGALAQAVQANGGVPSAEQAASLGRIQKEMEMIGRADFILIAIAMLTMATARYWTF